MRGYTRIALYKGQLVAVKEIDKPYVDIKTEQIRQELRIVSLFQLVFCLKVGASIKDVKLNYKP